MLLEYVPFGGRMKAISLLNMKGGVGKTTLAVNLAWSLARHRNKRVLLVDLDPQFNASQYLLTYDRWEQHKKLHGTIADVLLDAKRLRMQIKEPVKQNEFSILAQIERRSTGYLYLLPSELELARAVKNPQGVEFRLQKLLERWRQYFDYVLIDCAPTDTVLTATALMASNFVLVPIQPDRFSILGYGMMEKVLESFKSDYPDPNNVQDLGVVFTRVSKPENEIQARCKAEIAQNASHLFDTEIHDSNSYLRSVYEKTAVFDTRFSRAIVKSEITQLLDEIEIRVMELSHAEMAVAE